MEPNIKAKLALSDDDEDCQMSHDDFDVIAYKILAYAYACLKNGVEASIDKAQDVAGCNTVYFGAVIASLSESGYIQKIKPFKDFNGDIIAWGGDLVLTMEGACYLRENSTMAKVRSFLGKAFESALKVAVEATKAIGATG